MNAVDTNVWVYSHDSREPVKQQIALDTVAAARPMLLPWQVGCEFIAATRKLQPLGFTTDDAWRNLDNMRQMARGVAMPDIADWNTARDLATAEMLSFWDALLLATCLRHGVKTLYTEDLGSPRTIRGTQVVNPFAGV